MTEQIRPPVLEQYPQDLYSAVVAAVPHWISRRIEEIMKDVATEDVAQLQDEIVEVATQVLHTVENALFEILLQDVDEQRQNPMHVIRTSINSATELLSRYEVPLPHRDEFEIKAMPNDVYAIGPLTWKDLSEDVHETGITWGAWKAAVIVSRRRNEGKIS